MKDDALFEPPCCTMGGKYFLEEYSKFLASNQSTILDLYLSYLYPSCIPKGISYSYLLGSLISISHHLELIL